MNKFYTEYVVRTSLNENLFALNEIGLKGGISTPDHSKN